jgi:hypothetical protein
MKKIFVLFLAASAFSCSNGGGVGPLKNAPNANPQNSVQAPNSPDQAPKSPDQAPEPARDEFKIDFSFVNWPREMTDFERQALMLALNISGSFEGRESWTNISDNSDRQGMSLGLLSQNFGSGTLQPMILQIQKEYPEILAKIFSSPHLALLEKMIADWRASALNNVGTLSVAQASLLDDDGLVELAGTANSQSVRWAAKNIYHRGEFVESWKSEFQQLAGTPEFINLQFGEALKMHNLAKDYVGQVGVKELRSYLMMFDVVDQNGTIYPEDFTDYNRFLNLNKIIDTTIRLQKILELRLRHVSRRYSNDVKSRKLTIIKGRGVVHGLSRDLEREFVFNRLQNF